MRITYYALKTLTVGEDTRVAGDLVPEAKDWTFLSGYLSDGSIAPVLVATLPEEQQITLLDWEASQNPQEPEETPAPEPVVPTTEPPTPDPVQEPTPAPETTKPSGRKKAS